MALGNLASFISNQRQVRAEMTPAQRRALNRQEREKREQVREQASPEMRRMMDRATINGITLGATGGCELTEASASRRVARAAITSLNPMQGVGMLSRGASTLARELGASPDLVDRLDAPAQARFRANAANREGTDRLIDAARSLADRVF